MTIADARGSRRRGFAVVALVMGLSVGVSGCSEEAAPADSAPALSDALDTVDAAVEDGDPAKVRTAMEDLIARTAQARVDGAITPEQADEIFEAAQGVLAALPGERGRTNEADPE